MKRPPHRVIGDPPYMNRWFLIPKNRWFNIYLHQILRSDDDRVMHDHPWWSLSIMLKGRLFEHYQRGGLPRFRTIRPGRVVFRSAKFAHRLLVSYHRPAWTIFITGPRIRPWGFLCPKGWIPWQEFHGENDEIKGCGEFDSDLAPHSTDDVE